jgi:hypothetical protein
MAADYPCPCCGHLIGWRPIDLERDSFEPEGKQDAPWPEDPTVLYWWRPTFWRRDRRAAG